MSKNFIDAFFESVLIVGTINAIIFVCLAYTSVDIKYPFLTIFNANLIGSFIYALIYCYCRPIAWLKKVLFRTKTKLSSRSTEIVKRAKGGNHEPDSHKR